MQKCGKDESRRLEHYLFCIFVGTSSSTTIVIVALAVTIALLLVVILIICKKRQKTTKLSDAEDTVETHHAAIAEPSQNNQVCCS